MKTLALSAVLIALAGSVGFLLQPKQVHLYEAKLAIEIPPMDVRYAHSEDEGTIEHWVHCNICKSGIIRPETNTCSFCGKSPNQ
jgi:hypothetical protein